jgi:arsenate reductase
MDKKKVLFVCTHNSARSQIAEGIINCYYADRFDAYSAGSNPTEINPYSVSVCSEIGVDISSNYAKGFDDLEGIKFDYIVTVCDGATEKCPYFRGDGFRIHKSFNDPSDYKGSDEQKTVFFRNVRDEIRDWIDNVFINNI